MIDWPKMILGVDPGATTGLFAAWWKPGEIVTTPLQLPAAEVAPYVHMHLSAEARRRGAFDFAYVAIEKYVITARTAKLTQQPEALEVTGAVKAAMSIAGMDAAARVRQYLKANIPFASDDALKAAGWYTPGAPHANDAARQAFALLKDVDYPMWRTAAAGGMMESEDDDRGDDECRSSN